MKFKNRFEEWLKNNRVFDGYKKDCKEIWDAAENPLLEIIESVIKENRDWFFVQGEHLLSHDLRQKLTELLEK
jgi:hypothetical protein